MPKHATADEIVDHLRGFIAAPAGTTIPRYAKDQRIAKETFNNWATGKTHPEARAQLSAEERTALDQRFRPTATQDEVVDHLRGFIAAPAGTTMTQYAKGRNVSQANLSNWASGKKQPKARAQLTQDEQTALDQRLSSTTGEVVDHLRGFIAAPAGTTMTQYAKDHDISQTTLSNWVAGKSHPEARAQLSAEERTALDQRIRTTTTTTQDEVVDHLRGLIAAPAGITLTQYAKDHDIPPPTLNNWVTGRFHPGARARLNQNERTALDQRREQRGQAQTTAMTTGLSRTPLTSTAAAAAGGVPSHNQQPSYGQPGREVGGVTGLGQLQFAVGGVQEQIAAAAAQSPLTVSYGPAGSGTARSASSSREFYDPVKAAAYEAHSSRVSYGPAGSDTARNASSSKDPYDPVKSAARYDPKSGKRRRS
ncbi:hypothetical protein ACIBL8_48535 [Streptomyces sp. NPDC050523]|uniref:hypothetical protein n=1 Tax=Streptomyces sp. NPDC050523 TaxID=3365622 RepID=UPI0037B4F102